jgi:crotonobetainyl-CoA:carnitine CoA-transferase CaiB-like acyl-CoA transferase
VFSSNQVLARDMKIKINRENSLSGFVELIGNPVKFSKTPVTYRRAPPICGEHTDEIITEILDSQSDEKKGNKNV